MFVNCCFPSETSYDSASSGVGVSTPSTEGTLTPESLDNLGDVDSYENTEQVAKALIEFLVTRLVRLSIKQSCI